jgi:hypothetical protein
MNVVELKKHQRWTVPLWGLVSALVACGGTGAGDLTSGGAGPMVEGGSPGGGSAGDTVAGGGAGGFGTGRSTTTSVANPEAGPPGAGGSAGARTDTGATGADAGPGGPDGAVGPSDGSASASYVCTLILGILTTNEWFGGFEKVVDNARWELKFQDSAHIEKWADPANAVWSLPITSPCAKNADTPDRIVFMGVNYDYATVELFLPKYVAVLNNIKSKYPTVKRMDVMTYTRGPGNSECVGANRSNDSYIKPAQDQAISMFAAMYPDFVFPAPKWEVPSCSDFTLCPHLTGAANAVLSQTIGAYFLVN